MYYHPNGIGLGDAADYLAGIHNLVTTGTVWYVDSESGADAASPQGLSPEYPLATLDRAVTNATADDTVVLMSTHDETITANVFISKRLTIVGLGSSAGVPLAKLTNNVSGAGSISCTVPVHWRNIRFPEDGASAAQNKLSLAAGCRMTGCLVERGDNDPAGQGAIIAAIVGSGIQLVDCVFKSTGTDPTTPPYMIVMATAAQTDLLIQRCTFDAGITGFSGTYGLSISAAGTGVVLEDLTLNGADCFVHASSTGRYNVTSSTGHSKVVW